MVSTQVVYRRVTLRFLFVSLLQLGMQQLGKQRQDKVEKRFLHKQTNLVDSQKDSSYLVGSKFFLERWPGYERKMPLCVPMYVQGTSFKISLERFFHISSIIDVICTSGLKHGRSGGSKTKRQFILVVLGRTNRLFRNGLRPLLQNEDKGKAI